MKGLGNDIIEIERVRKSIERHGIHFINRLFTEEEQKYCNKHQDPIPVFAGRFAAKEAISKALGIGIGEHLHWRDVEILNEENGKPILKVSEKVKEKFQNPKILVSISHCHAYATAVAIWVG